MNVINLTGRVVKDCELSMLPGTGTAKISFTICVERKYQKDKNNKKVDFIPIEMLGAHTEKLAQYVTKGKMIGITGELHIDQYEKDGQKKSFTKVNADRLEFLGTLGEGNRKDNDPTGRFKEVLDDDDLPF